MSCVRVPPYGMTPLATQPWRSSVLMPKAGRTSLRADSKSARVTCVSRSGRDRWRAPAEVKASARRVTRQLAGPEPESARGFGPNRNASCGRSKSLYASAKVCRRNERQHPQMLAELTEFAWVRVRACGCVRARASACASVCVRARVCAYVRECVRARVCVRAVARAAAPAACRQRPASGCRPAPAFQRRRTRRSSQAPQSRRQRSSWSVPRGHADRRPAPGTCPAAHKRVRRRAATRWRPQMARGEHATDGGHARRRRALDWTWRECDAAQQRNGC
eukprot:2295025-Pleurochrysis_carterae.AAC.2